MRAYPLQWPQGWPRTETDDLADSKDRFKRNGSGYGRSSYWTLGDATQELLRQIEMLGGFEPIISSNYTLRNDGLPRASQRPPEDRGIAVYFDLGGKPMAMACDLHIRSEENMRSLALSIDALRTLGRHGGGHMMNQAFTGFTALPAPGASKHWTEVLGLHSGARAVDINNAFRAKAIEAHPDRGGSDAKMAELNKARDDALAGA